MSAVMRGPLTSITLREQAVDQLRSRILTGDIGAGRMYSVSALATELGASATPIREALQQLTQEGLVEIRRNRGFFVPVLGERDLDELYELRTMLEVPAMRRLAATFDGSASGEWRALAGTATELARQGDAADFVVADGRFHLGLLGLVGNRRLVETVGRLRDQARMYGLARLGATGVLTRSAAEHFELLDALEDHDSAEAARVMKRHLGHTRGIRAGHTKAAAITTDAIAEEQ
jgi:DNA-binding GntR family transcriptional regulator